MQHIQSSKEFNPAAYANKRNASVALVAIAVCVCASAQTSPTSTGSSKVTLEMCATTAFRNKNEKVCDALEASVMPKASSRDLSPSLSVPTTSPNYGKAPKN